MASTPLIQIKNVKRQFGDVVAVNDVSLDIYEGEFFALLGASGSGKTTLLRLLAGFESADAGEIFLDGQSITQLPAYQRPLNMMFQSYALFPHMTVAQNIGFGLKYSGLAKAERNRRTEEMLGLVKLDEYGHRKPHQLSGGQRQRVALARALAKKPKLLLLDEPLGALDKKLREETQFELTKLQRALGLTFIVVTHDQDEAMRLATRMAIMEKGEIQQLGTPQEIYDNPRTSTVASFIGSGTFIAGTLSAKIMNRCEVRTSQGLVCATTALTQANLGNPVLFFVRPEHIHIVMERPASSHNTVQGTVREVLFCGDHNLYRVVSAQGDVFKVQGVTLGSAANRVPAVGDVVWLTWDISAGRILTS